MVLLKFYTFEVKPQVAADGTDPVFFCFFLLQWISSSSFFPQRPTNYLNLCFIQRQYTELTCSFQAIHINAAKTAKT